MAWRRVACCRQELRLDITLACGQSFRWQETAHGEWRGVLANRIWTLSQNETELLYKVHTTKQPETFTSQITPDPTDIKVESQDWKPQIDNTKVESSSQTISDLCEVKTETKPDVKISPEELILQDYFQLNINLCKLYKQWCSVDKNFKSKAENFTGVRILRQDPVENLFAFICSSNNHISRISSMVEKLCTEYGEHVGTVDGKEYYSFPSVSSLTGDSVEQRLRTLGFGYRAKYIRESARYIDSQGKNWLEELRSKPYSEARAELMKLSGVGPKVADCVCLMSLDKSSCIPVDTHVWQITLRDYIPRLKTAKSLTDKTYKEIGDFFRDLWGDYAGWAHSVLFSADLKKFQQKPEMKAADVKSPKRKSSSVTKATRKKTARK